MATNWKKLYGPTTAANTSANVIYTTPVQTSVVLTKVTISNISGTAALATLAINSIQLFQRSVPGYPTQGGVLEVTELEGHTLSATDTITFTAGTANVLALMISGVEYQP